MPANGSLNLVQGTGHGRPVGALNKRTTEARDLARALVEDPEYRQLLLIRIKVGEAPHMETLLWHYAYGKPKETVELSGGLAVIGELRSVIVDPKSPPDITIVARDANDG